MPNSESIVLWLRNNLPDVSEDIVSRAREHYLVLEPPKPVWKEPSFNGIFSSSATIRAFVVNFDLP
jgi:hypothetical protein